MTFVRGVSTSDREKNWTCVRVGGEDVEMTSRLTSFFWKLRDLKFAEKVSFVVGHDRAVSNDMSEQQILERLVDADNATFRDAMSVWHSVHGGRSPANFRVVCKRHGKKTKGSCSSMKLANELAGHLTRRFPDIFGNLPVCLDREKFDLEVSLVVNDEELLLSIPIWKHRSAGAGPKNNHEVGLAEPVCFAMARSARIGREDVVLDPMCGRGTILLEALRCWPEANRYIGIDQNDEQLARFYMNCKNRKLQTYFTIDDSYCASESSASAENLRHRRDRLGELIQGLNSKHGNHNLRCETESIEQICIESSFDILSTKPIEGKMFLVAVPERRDCNESGQNTLHRTGFLAMLDSCGRPSFHVDIVLCDLPYGRQFGSIEDNQTLYPEFTKFLAKILRRPNGRFVLLTSMENLHLLIQCLLEDGLHVTELRRLTLGFLAAVIVVGEVSREIAADVVVVPELSDRLSWEGARGRLDWESEKLDMRDILAPAGK